MLIPKKASSIFLITLAASCFYPLQLHGEEKTLPTNQVMTTGLAVTDTTITVGQIHSETGSMAISESGSIEAERLAIEQINRSGGILGRHIKYLFRDGATDWPTFKIKAKELVEEKKVTTVFGGWTSASRKAMLPIFEKNNNLLFYPTFYEGLETSPNIIYTGQEATQQIWAALEWAIREKNAKTFYLIGSKYIWPITSQKIAKEYIERNGGTVIPGIDTYTESHLKGFPADFPELGHRKFQKYIEHIKAIKPDCVFSIVVGASNISFYNQLKKSGITSENQFLLTISVTEDELLGIGGENFEGFYSSTKYFQSMKGENNRKFIEQFKENVDEEATIGDVTESAYLGPWIYKAAVEKAGSFDIDKVRTALPNLTIDNAPHGEVRVHATNQHLWFKTLIGKGRKDGQFDIVWESDQLIEPNPWPQGKEAGMEILKGF